jgi:hypothetical protein
MKIQEQLAFIETYADNVAELSKDKVSDFIERYNRGENIEYSEGYAGIMDALGIWRDAIAWNLRNKHENNNFNL